MTFLEEDVYADEEFTFTINSVRNPAVMGLSYSIFVEILSETGGAIDVGTFTIDEDAIVKGEVWVFKVTP